MSQIGIVHCAVKLLVNRVFSVVPCREHMGCASSLSFLWNTKNFLPAECDFRSPSSTVNPLPCYVLWFTLKNTAWRTSGLSQELIRLLLNRIVLVKWICFIASAVCIDGWCISDGRWAKDETFYPHKWAAPNCSVASAKCFVPCRICSSRI